MAHTVIGIDPSLCSTGLVSMRGGKATHVQAVRSRPAGGAAGEMDRIWDVIGEIRSLVLFHEDMETPIDVVAIEGTVNFGHGNHSPVIGLNYIIRDRLMDWDVPFIVVPPTVLKKFCGKGNMKKEEMRLAVFKKWGFEAKTNDEVDAFALAKLADQWITCPRMVGKVDVVGRISKRKKT